MVVVIGDPCPPAEPAGDREPVHPTDPATARAAV